MHFELRRYRSVASRVSVPLVVGVVFAAAAVQLSLLGGALVMGLFAVLLGLAALFTVWSVSFYAMVNTQRVDELAQAQLVLVTPPAHKGSAAFVPLLEDGSISFQERRFLWDASRSTFVKLAYLDKKSVEEYSAAVGLSEASYRQAEARWGLNSITIPLPTFGQLYLEHALEPFFVFQMVVVVLWCLDEMWMYSLMTGAMLIALEATTVNRRLAIVKSLRGMLPKPKRVKVRRDNRWVVVRGSEIVPGDLVELCGSKGAKSKPFMIPCDLVLVSGTAVVNEALLTGESVALLKESVAERQPEEILDFKTDRTNVLFGGTKLMQHSAGAMKTPDQGAVGFAVRTGFASSQGKVLRAIHFASKNTRADPETLLFMLFLLVWAVLAAGYVLYWGLQETRSRYKLLVEVSIILTSVVPPELPIQLSMAVNTSLIALRALRVFCTEPFRIPYAGRLDICAFDKTGTLTQDDLIFKGVRVDDKLLKKNTPAGASLVVGACQGLALVNGRTLGDPLEISAVTGLGWRVKTATSVLHTSSKRHVDIVRRFNFRADLKRMTTVVKSEGHFYVCMKGAPETVAQFLKSGQSVGDYQALAREGYRVLALASAPLELEDQSVGSIREMDRELLERELLFEGLLVFECPVREKSPEILKQLSTSGHKNVMVTGDNELTACSVAMACGMADSVLVLRLSSDDRLIWSTMDEKEVQLATDELPSSEAALCVTGAMIDWLTKNGRHVLLHKLAQTATVWARASPDHKAFIMNAMREAGLFVLFMGDGSNDVGALKRSNVGVALVYEETPPPAKTVPVRSVKKKPADAKPKKPTSFSEAMEKAVMSEMAGLQVGDAAIAAHFTVRSASIEPVLQIIRQGRCTLVSTMQMFKILALNCLITAFSMSVLSLEGVKLGDTQMTVAGMVMLAAYFFLTRSQPAPTLAPSKPQQRIFTIYFITSLMLQFAVHLCALYATTSLVRYLEPGSAGTQEYDADFAPNLINTCVYLIQISMQLATFAVNYEGAPHMQKSKYLVYSLVAGAVFCCVAAIGLLDEPLGLVATGDVLKLSMIGIMAGDFVLAFALERICAALFK